MGRRDLAPLLLLTVLWVLASVSIGPSGEFPLNDDWSYALAARSLYEDGELRLSAFTSMPLVTQLVWSWPFLGLAGGFSFSALRVSTLVLAWAGIVAVYGSVRTFRSPPWHAFVVAFAVMSTAVFVVLAATFMSDIPFLSLLLLAFWALFHGLERRQTGWVAVACGLAVLATLVRQLGLAFAVGAAVVIWLTFGRNWGAACWALVPLIIGVLSLVAFERYLLHQGRLPLLYTTKTQGLRDMLLDLLHLRLGALRAPLVNARESLLHLGLWLAPAVLCLARWTRRQAVVLALVGVLAVVAATTFGPWLPRQLQGNMLVGGGLGPPTLAGPAPMLPRWCWIALSTLGAVGVTAIGLVLGGRLVGVGVAERAAGKRWWRLLWAGDTRATALLFLTLTNIVYWLPLACQYGPFFDRYLLLPFVSLLLVWGMYGASRAELLRVGAASVVTLVVAVGFTHDYLAWNRTRWQLIGDLRSQGVPSAAVAGGFEHDEMRAEEERRGASAPPAAGPHYRVEFAGAGAADAADRARTVLERRAGTWMPGVNVQVRAVKLPAPPP